MIITLCLKQDQERREKVVISYQKKVYLLDYLYLKVDSDVKEAKAEYETTEIGAFARGVLGGKNAGGMIEETINAVKGFISECNG